MGKLDFLKRFVRRDIDRPFIARALRQASDNTSWLWPCILETANATQKAR